jgi:hypothetical protein
MGKSSESNLLVLWFSQQFRIPQLITIINEVGRQQETYSLYNGPFSFCYSLSSSSSPIQMRNVGAVSYVSNINAGNNM